MKPKPFEELIAGANPDSEGPLTNAEICFRKLLILRCSPAVMREVWEALREAGDPNNWFYDEGAYQMVCRKSVQTRCRRALAALNGEKPDGKEGAK